MKGLLVAAVGALFLCQGTAWAQPQTVWISGSVVSADRTPPKANVVVQPLEPRWTQAARLAEAAGLPTEIDAPQSYSAETSETGDYRIEVPAGLWSIRVEAAGHHPVCLEAVPLVSDRDLGAIRLEQRSGPRIRLVDGEGEALPTAFLLPPEPAARAYEWTHCSELMPASAEGYVHAPTVTDGTWTVAAPGYLPKVLSELPTTGVVTLERRAQESSEILVRSAGDPFPKVLALGGDGRWPVAVSDSSGRLSVPLDSPPLGLLAPDGRLEEQASVDGANVDFAPPVAVRGVILRSLSESPPPGIAGALVWCDDAPGISTRSDAEGRFALAHVPLDPSESVPAIRIGAAAPDYQEEDFSVAAGLPGSDIRRQLLDLKLRLLEASSQGRFGGRLVDPTGGSIEGARVLLVPTAAVDRRTRMLAGADVPGDPPRAVTDSLGRFTIEGQGEGFWDLVASHPSRRPLVLPGLPPLEPGELRDLGDLTLSEPWSLGGTVLDSERRPVAGVRVEQLFRYHVGDWTEAIPDTAGEPSWTGPEGRFTVRMRIPEGVSTGVDLRFSRDGFQPSVLRNVVGRPESEPEILLQPLASLSGRVVSHEDEPVSGARLRLLPSAGATGVEPPGGLPAPATTTDERGRFEIEHLAPEPSWLEVEADGFATQRLEVTPSPPEARSLTIHLLPGVELSGVVLLPTGEPVERAIVEVASELTETDVEGGFELGHLSSGLHVIRASHGDLGQVQQEVFLDPTEPGAPLTLVLSQEWVLQGRVVDDEGRAVSGASVFASDPLGSGSAAFSDADGRFRFLDLAPGRYELSAATSNRATLNPEPVTLGSAGAHPAVTLVTHPRGRIEGLILGSEGRPGQLRVTWSCPDGWTQRGEVFPDSTFRIDGARLGECWVTAREVGSNRWTTERVRLSPTDPVESVNLLFDDHERLDGRLSRGGTPLDGAPVSVWTADGCLVAETLTDSSGTFQVVGLPPGDYALSVDLGGVPMVFPGTVTVPSSPVDWDLETGALRVDVEDPQGSAVRSARAVARPTYDGPGRAIRAVCFEGACHWPRLAPGRYRVDIDATGHDLRRIEVEVGESRRVHTSVRLHEPR